MTTLSFANREEYITWRDQWRETYKNLSLTIRKNKAKAAQFSKDGDHAGFIQALLVVQRLNANEMMETRMETKNAYNTSREDIKMSAAA